MPDNPLTVQERLVKIETKLDIFLGDHENRIRSLEKWKTKASGVLGVVVLCIPVIIFFLG